MGSGVSLSGSMSKGSEFVYDFDFTCSKCATRQASHYCQICNIYFCKSCLHQACDHELLGRQLVSKWKPGQTTFILECPDHAGNRLETYCKTHDVVCCSTCVSLNHTQCVGMNYTQTSAMGVLKGQEIPQLQKRLSGSPSITGHKIRLNQQYKIKSVVIEKDKKECHILGMCLLPSGYIVLADFNNGNIKQLDTDYRMVDSLSLHSSPFDVCYVGDRELVVVLVNMLQFITVGNTMSLSHSLITKHACSSVAYHKDKLAVLLGAGGELYLYSLHCGAGSHSDPQLTNKIECDMLYLPRHITYSPDGSQLYVADQYAGLVKLDNAGNLLALSSPSELQYAEGVCVDSVGNVFVCCGRSHNVLQAYSDENYKVTTIAAKSDGINNPQALCFDSAQSVLYVAESNSSLVKVFHLQQ